jgi:hypothetical protein
VRNSPDYSNATRLHSNQYALASALPAIRRCLPQSRNRRPTDTPAIKPSKQYHPINYFPPLETAD